VQTEETDCPVCGNSRGKTLLFARDNLLGHAGRFREVSCSECGLLYINPRPRSRDMGLYYKGSYAPHAKKPKPARRHSGLAKKFLKSWYRLSDLRTRLKKDAFSGPKGSILDIGCGAGAFLYRLRELGWEAHGVETDPDASEVARNLGLRVHTGTLDNASYPEERFDIVTVVHVLEHLHRPGDFMKDVNRVAKPGGLLYVEVPNLKSFNFRIFRGDWFHLDAPRHLCSYWRKPLVRLLAENGFRVLKIRHLSGTVGLRGSIQYRRHSKGLEPVKWLDRKIVKKVLGLFTFALDFARRGDVIRVDAVKVSNTI
jgi:2-polyprenyl-3-methyl-5-hydroxy-6-metoxy-1,4-benzoquinol methylase